MYLFNFFFFFNNREQLNNAKQLIEEGIVKWTEYDDQYKEAADWLNKMEGLVQSFNKLQSSLEMKKSVLEDFQVYFHQIIIFHYFYI